MFRTGLFWVKGGKNIRLALPASVSAVFSRSDKSKEIS
jgi:hypothetical protein